MLEQLYAEPPTAGTRPTPETLPEWEKRAEELLAEQVSIAGGAAALRVGRHRLLTLVLAFLRRDADRRDTYDDVRVEASFGFDAEGDPGALDFGDWELHGFIDRIDVDRSRGTAIVHDYKLSREVPAHGSFESKRRMQLALYLKAVQEKWDLQPDAGLYQPLGKAGSGVPRGLARKEVRDDDPGAPRPPQERLGIRREVRGGRRHRRVARHRLRGADPRRGDRPQPARRQVPLVLHLRPDLPHGPQGRPRWRWRGVSRTPEQRAAIDRRDRDVFLRAGAGTGKTGVLVDRYCAAVADDGVSPEAILAFTFTERAAGELRRRVRAELVRRAAEAKGPDGDPELAQRLDDAIRGLGAAPITTIHGFCRRLLSAHPVAAGLDPALPRARCLRGDPRRLGRLRTGAGGPARRRRRHRRAGRRRLPRRSRAGPDPRRLRGAPQPRRGARAAADHSARPRRGRAADEERRRQRRRARREAAASRTAALPARRSWPALPDGRLPTFEELAELESDSSSKVTERQACLDAIAEAIAVAAEPGQGMEVYGVFGRALHHFAKRYDEAKRERSGLDFEDLQLGAVSLLRDSPGIGSSYRERFAHLLVDEFQDTNALQLALIEQLRGPDSRLFVVGDRFQAIYGFRHADIGVFNREEERFRERPRAEVLSLTGNFRSRPQIIAAANAMGAATMSDFAELSAGRPEPDAAGANVELLVTEPKGWDDEEMGLERRSGDPMPADAVAEARNVAQRLRVLADEGAAAGDMVVLLRAFTHVDAFEEALDRVGLAPYVAGGGGYWSQQQTQDMICLLSAVANPLADEQMLGVLASPACGVSPDTLWLLRRAVGSKRTIWRAILAAAGAEQLELEDSDALDRDPRRGPRAACADPRRAAQPSAPRRAPAARVAGRAGDHPVRL